MEMGVYVVQGVQGLFAILHSLLALLELAQHQLVLCHMHAQEQQGLLRPRMLRLYQVRYHTVQEGHCARSSKVRGSLESCERRD